MSGVKLGTDTIAIPPGETIREQLEIRNMTQREFAIRMDLSEKHINRLINGQVALTPDVAVRLESVLGVPAHIWSRLEAAYREALVKVKEENELESDEEIAEKIPYTELAKLGWVEKAQNSIEKVWNLRRYFEVASLGAIDELRMQGIAFRLLNTEEKNQYAAMAWTQQARRVARKTETSAIDLERLKSAIPVIRAMTTQTSQEFQPKLYDLLAGCGVALVVLPHLKGSFLQGATFYDGNHIVLGLTLRGKDSDRFWFSLFHEIAHIMYGHINSKTAIDDKQEREADGFAQNILVPQNKYQAFIKVGSFAKTSIVAFSEEIGIASGIVLGRLQKDGKVSFSQFNELKTQFAFKF
jgi:HTH-type transcriptional regulator/antitoxin HigA